MGSVPLLSVGGGLGYWRRRDAVAAALCCRGERVDGAMTEPTPVEQTLRYHFLHQTLYHFTIETKTHDAGDDISGGAMGFLRRDNGEDFIRRRAIRT